jgi:hypothetical protein
MAIIVAITLAYVASAEVLKQSFFRERRAATGR